jgi:hypothetical protein
MIDLPVRNEWSNIELLRTAVLKCFTAVFHDVDRCQAIAVVISELLENAIKYGAWDDAGDLPIHLTVTGQAGGMLVTVEHPVDPVGPQVARLREIIDWIGGRPSPEDAYRERLTEYAANPPADGGSRLGLVRIAYEGNCRLTANISGRRLVVSADTRQ